MIKKTGDKNEFPKITDEKQRMIKKIFQKIFSSEEAQVVIRITEDACRKFDNKTFEKVIKPKIDKSVRQNPKKLKEIIKKIPPREWVYSIIANISGDLLESGTYHIYRGLLMEEGEDLLKIFDEATEELVRIGSIEKGWAENQRRQLRENIKTVG